MIILKWTLCISTSIFYFLSKCCGASRYMEAWSCSLLTTLFATLMSFTTSCAFIWIPMRGATTYCRSFISSYNHPMVSSFGPIYSCISELNYVMLKLYEYSHRFFTTRCFFYWFTTTSSLLNIKCSLSTCLEFLVLLWKKKYFFTMISLGFILVLTIITFSIKSKMRLWGSFGEYLFLCCMILLLSQSNMTLHISVTMSPSGGVVPITPSGRWPPVRWSSSGEPGSSLMGFMVSSSSNASSSISWVNLSFSSPYAPPSS